MRITYLSLAVWDLASIRAYIAAEDPAAAQRVGKRLSAIASDRAVNRFWLVIGVDFNHQIDFCIMQQRRDK